MNLISLDLVFSYWIFLWFILYDFKIIPYSPKLAIIISILDNLVSSIYLYIRNAPFTNLMKYIFINTLIKVIPLAFVWSDPIRLPIDVYILTVLFIFYLGWLYFNNTTLLHVYKDLINHYVDKNKGKETISGYYFYKVFGI